MRATLNITAVFRLKAAARRLETKRLIFFCRRCVALNAETILNPGYYTSMGFGVPAALGAGLARLIVDRLRWSVTAASR